MAAAAPVVGAIITSVVVSKVVTTIAPKLGISEDVAGLVGMIAGAYAGGAAFTAASTPASAAGATTGGAAAATGFEGGVLRGGVPGSAAPGPVAPSAAPPVRGGGLLSEGAGPDMSTKIYSPSGTVRTAMEPVARTNTGPVSAPVQTQAPAGNVAGPPAPEKSWTERLFSPEKTMDLVMAGLQGHAQAGMRKHELEYPEKVKQKNADDWAAAYPGQLSLKQPGFLSQE